MRFILIILCFVALASCQDRVICSAFQSTYILDDSTRHAYYSSYWRLDAATQEKFLASIAPQIDSLDTAAVGGTGDMTPYYEYVEKYLTPITNPRRSSFGVVKYEPEWMKNYKLKSSPMENVYGPEKDKLEVEEEVVDIGEFVATNEDSTLVMDSTFLADEDSLLIAPVDSAMLVAEEGEEPQGPRYLYGYDPADDFNVEQEYYNKYFGYLLVAPPPKKKESAASDSTQVAQEPNLATDSTQTEEKGGLFRRKKSDQEEPAEPIEGIEGDPQGAPNEEEEGSGTEEGGGY